MLFIHPMWDHEHQRLGMQACSPRAYELHGFGELVGFVGLLALFGTLAAYAVAKGLSWRLLAIPFGIGIVSEVLVQLSWRMVDRHGFEYDFNTHEATWMRDGKRVTYRSPEQGGPQEIPGGP